MGPSAVAVPSAAVMVGVRVTWVRKMPCLLPPDRDAVTDMLSGFAASGVQSFRFRFDQ
jgi:hypothetical protein